MDNIHFDHHIIHEVKPIKRVTITIQIQVQGHEVLKLVILVYKAKVLLAVSHRDAIAKLR